QLGEEAKFVISAKRLDGSRDCIHQDAGDESAPAKSQPTLGDRLTHAGSSANIYTPDEGCAGCRLLITVCHKASSPEYLIRLTAICSRNYTSSVIVTFCCLPAN